MVYFFIFFSLPFQVRRESDERSEKEKRTSKGKSVLETFEEVRITGLDKYLCAHRDDDLHHNHQHREAGDSPQQRALLTFHRTSWFHHPVIGSGSIGPGTALGSSRSGLLSSPPVIQPGETPACNRSISRGCITDPASNRLAEHMTGARDEGH